MQKIRKSLFYVAMSL